MPLWARLINLLILYYLPFPVHLWDHTRYLHVCVCGGGVTPVSIYFGVSGALQCLQNLIQHKYVAPSCHDMTGQKTQQ